MKTVGKLTIIVSVIALFLFAAPVLAKDCVSGSGQHFTCPDDKLCGYNVNECITLKKTCESCSGPADCASGNCVNNKCVAASCPPGSVCIPNPVCSETFGELLDKITGFIFWVAIGLAPVMVAIGAFILATAAGSPEKFKTAMNIFLYTGIGTLLVLMARALASVIENIF